MFTILIFINFQISVLYIVNDNMMRRIIQRNDDDDDDNNNNNIHL